VILESEKPAFFYDLARIALPALTCLPLVEIARYQNLTFLGIDFKMKTIEVDDKKIKIQIWDTAGQERFKTITQTYYKGAMGIILAYAVDDRESFQNIESWMRQIKQHANENVCMTLVATKCDVPNRTVNYDEGKQLADSYGMPFFETSSKKDIHINETFYSITKDIKDRLFARGKQSAVEVKPINANQKLQKVLNEDPNKKESSGCCS